MAEGQADRLVLFKLGARVDGGAVSAFQAFSGMFDQLDKRAKESAEGIGKSLASAVDRASSSTGRNRGSASDPVLAGMDAELKRVEAIERTKTRAFEKEQREIERQEKAKQKALESQQKAFEKAQLQEAKLQQKAKDDAVRAAENAIAKAESASSKLKESFGRSMEGALKLGEGFAKLGLVGSKSLEELVKGLVVVRGTADVVRGLMDLWSGITGTVRAYRTAIEAAAVAQTALAVAQAKTTVAGGGSAAAGAIGGAVGGGVGATAIGTAGVTAGAWGAGIGGGALGTYSLYKFGESVSKYGLGGGADQDSLFGKIAEGEAKLANWFGKATGWFDLFGDTATEARQKLSEETDRLAKLRGEIAAIRAGGELEKNQVFADAAIRKIDAKFMGAGLGNRSAEENLDLSHQKAVAIQSFMAQQSSQARERLGGYEQKWANAYAEGKIDGHAIRADDRAEYDSKIAAARKEVESTSERERQATQERLRIEQQIAQQKIKTADEAIQKARDEIAIREEAIKIEQEKYMSAAERFGRLDVTDQREIIGLAEQARANGGQGMRRLDTEQIGRLESFGDSEMQKLARQEFVRRAEAQGYGQTFGREERKNVEELGKEISGLQVQLKSAQDFKISVQLESDKLQSILAKQIEESIDRELPDIIKRLEETTQEAINAKLRASNKNAIDRASLVPK